MKLVLKCFDDKMLHCFYAMNDWKDWKCIGTQNSGSLSFPEKIKEEFELNHCWFLLDDKENPSSRPILFLGNIMGMVLCIQFDFSWCPCIDGVCNRLKIKISHAVNPNICGCSQYSMLHSSSEKHNCAWSYLKKD